MVSTKETALVGTDGLSEGIQLIRVPNIESTDRIDIGAVADIYHSKGCRPTESDQPKPFDVDDSQVEIQLVQHQRSDEREEEEREDGEREENSEAERDGYTPSHHIVKEFFSINYKSFDGHTFVESHEKPPAFLPPQKEEDDASTSLMKELGINTQTGQEPSAAKEHTRSSKEINTSIPVKVGTLPTTLPRNKKWRLVDLFRRRKTNVAAKDSTTATSEKSATTIGTDVIHPRQEAELATKDSTTTTSVESATAIGTDVIHPRQEAELATKDSTTTTSVKSATAIGTEVIHPRKDTDAATKDSTTTTSEKTTTTILTEVIHPSAEKKDAQILTSSCESIPPISKSVSVRFFGIDSVVSKRLRKETTPTGETTPPGEEDTPSVASTSTKSSATPPAVDITQLIDVKPEIYEQMATLREMRNQSLYMYRHISDISSLGAQGHMSVYNFSEAVKELPIAVESFSQDVSHITLDFLRESFNLSADDTDRNEDDESVGLNPIGNYDGSSEGCYKVNATYFCEALHEECSPIMTCRWE